jgi:hypothetical protein
VRETTRQNEPQLIDEGKGGAGEFEVSLRDRMETAGQQRQAADI